MNGSCIKTTRGEITVISIHILLQTVHSIHIHNLLHIHMYINRSVLQEKVLIMILIYILMLHVCFPDDTKLYIYIYIHTYPFVRRDTIHKPTNTKLRISIFAPHIASQVLYIYAHIHISYCKKVSNIFSHDIIRYKNANYACRI